MLNCGADRSNAASQGSEKRRPKMKYYSPSGMASQAKQISNWFGKSPKADATQTPKRNCGG